MARLFSKRRSVHPDLKAGKFTLLGVATRLRPFAKMDCLYSECVRHDERVQTVVLVFVVLGGDVHDRSLNLDVGFEALLHGRGRSGGAFENVTLGCRKSKIWVSRPQCAASQFFPVPFSTRMGTLWGRGRAVSMMWRILGTSSDSSSGWRSKTSSSWTWRSILVW